MTHAASVDIVVVSFNACEDLRRCLVSLRDAPPRRPWSLTVVDNASQDGSLDVVREVMPSARLIALERNAGFAAANNAGIRAGHGDLVLLLNSDTVVPPGAIDGLIEALQSASDSAAAGPRLVDAAGRPELSFGRMISPWNELRQKFIGGPAGRGRRWTRRLVERMARTRQHADWVSGACLLVWRADAEAVGLLDERYFMYAEDVDFCAALRARDRRVLFAPSVEIVHLGGRSRASVPDATQRAYRRSQLAFYEKHHPRWHRWLAWYLRVKGAHPVLS